MALVRRNVFVGYRREDSAGHAGRLHDRFVARWGTDRVFLDIDSLSPGDDFVEVIDRTLDECLLVVLVIGPRWLDIRDDQGCRRIDNSVDYHRREIEQSLQRKVRMIPVLVGGARMPIPSNLPESLSGLCRLNAFEVSDRRFNHDSLKLVEVMNVILSEEIARYEIAEAQASAQSTLNDRTHIKTKQGNIQSKEDQPERSDGLAGGNSSSGAKEHPIEPPINSIRDESRQKKSIAYEKFFSIERIGQGLPKEKARELASKLRNIKGEHIAVFSGALLVIFFFLKGLFWPILKSNYPIVVTPSGEIQATSANVQYSKPPQESVSRSSRDAPGPAQGSMAVAESASSPISRTTDSGSTVTRASVTSSMTPITRPRTPTTHEPAASSISQTTNPVGTPASDSASGVSASSSSPHYTPAKGSTTNSNSATSNQSQRIDADLDTRNGSKRQTDSEPSDRNPQRQVVESNTAGQAASKPSNARVDNSHIALGAMSVKSALGEPMRFLIEVKGLSQDNLNSAKFRLASPDAYRAAGVDYSELLDSASLRLVPQADGSLGLEIRTTRPITEPVLDVIIEANFPNGRVVRNYTLLFY